MEVNWHRERKVYSQAYERIKEFVQINIIDIKKCVLYVKWVATILRMQAYLLRYRKQITKMVCR